MDTTFHNRIKKTQKMWLASYFLYYLYRLVIFSVDRFFGLGSFYEFFLWVIPLVHYLAYKAQNVYWFTFFTGWLAPVCLFSVIGEGLVLLKTKIVFFMCFIFLILFMFFLVMSNKLLHIFAANNEKRYKRAVKSVWLFSFFTYYGLCIFESVVRYANQFELLTLENWARIAGRLSGVILITYIVYFFVIRRKSVPALVITIILIPKQCMMMPGYINSFLLFGLFASLCFCSYRLYKIQARK